LSRDHVVQTSSSGLVTITGGKWTTYRKMGEDAVDAAIKASTLPLRASRTQTMKINAGAGSLAPGDEGPHLLARFPSVDDEFVRRAVRLEMARHVEDVLARRTRLLFVDAQQALAASVRVAEVLAAELSRSPDWMIEECERFQQLAARYQPSAPPLDLANPPP
jgi:glycerol-3-phosphate dehydrogenase